MDKTTSSIWRYKRQNAKNRGIEFTLTEDDIATLLSEAGITPNDVGQRADQYCLSRHNDEGAYSMGNVKYITQAENRALQTKGGPAKGYSFRQSMTEEQISASRKNSWITRRKKYGSAGTDDPGGWKKRRERYGANGRK